MCFLLQVSSSSFIDSSRIPFVSLFLLVESLFQFLCCGSSSCFVCFFPLLLSEKTLLSLLFVASFCSKRLEWHGINATDLADQKTNLRGESPEDCLKALSVSSVSYHTVHASEIR